MQSVFTFSLPSVLFFAIMKGKRGRKENCRFMSYRESIRVVDTTLRDGGLVNDFKFSDDFVRALYKANLAAGVDYMEVGYRSSKTIFDASQFGAWKFSEDEVISKVIGEVNPAIKLAVMADVGRCDFKNDIRQKKESPISLIRVATYIHQVSDAIEMIEDAKEKGYEVSCNLMAISKATPSELRVALDMISKSNVDVIYVVDSFGSLYPEQVRNFVKVYKEFAGKTGKKLGIHAHNNQQLAFANTIAACCDGVDWVDATYGGMGRGAGNCYMENLIGYLHNSKYDLLPVIQFVEEHVKALKNSKDVWGFDIPYLLTGISNQHPRTAISYIKEGRNDITSFFNELEKS